MHKKPEPTSGSIMKRILKREAVKSESEQTPKEAIEFKTIHKVRQIKFQNTVIRDPIVVTNPTRSCAPRRSKQLAIDTSPCSSCTSGRSWYWQAIAVISNRPIFFWNSIFRVHILLGKRCLWQSCQKSYHSADGRNRSQSKEKFSAMKTQRWRGFIIWRSGEPKEAAIKAWARSKWSSELEARQSKPQRN